MMAKFGPASKKRFVTLDARLQMILEIAIKQYDFAILCGSRSKEEQDKLFKEGKSKLMWPASKHNNAVSLAVDIAPYPIDWKNRERFVYLAGLIQGIAVSKGIKIRWGGDWDMDNDLKDQSFNDLPHFELI